jgi:hypothetical protein
MNSKNNFMRVICLTTLMMGSGLLAMEQELKKSAIETAQYSQEELGKQLIEAAAKGDQEEIERLIRRGANINHADKAGDTALIEAARYNHKECVLMLIDAGANVNINTTGHTALSVVAALGYTECVSILINANTNLHQALKYVSTILMPPSYNNHRKICEMLAEAMLRPTKDQKQAVVALLSIKKRELCLERIKTCWIPREIVRLIGQYSLDAIKQANNAKTLKEIGEISNDGHGYTMRQYLLTKYFPNHSNGRK